ncbi:MAG TPA: type II secretion system protein [Candidatus Limnocylindrales bacterium]
MQRIVRHRRRPEDGYTLVEILVAILILGVIMAIAIPVMIGARERAQNSAAKASVRGALMAGRIIFSTEQDYAAATLVLLNSTEPSIDWVDATSTSAYPTTVSRDTTGGVLTLAAYSVSGTCFFLMDDPPNDTRFGVLTDVAPADCYAGNAAAVTFGTRW